jgi:hypothetical protein
VTTFEAFCASNEELRPIDGNKIFSIADRWARAEVVFQRFEHSSPLINANELRGWKTLKSP